MYLEQESKFDSTKDASDLGAPGAGTSLVKDYASSLPDSIKVKGGGQDRSYDEAWQVDQGSQNSCQHGEGSCDQRLDSAQTCFVSKRRPSANRFNQDFFDTSVQRSEDTDLRQPVEHPAPKGQHRVKKQAAQFSQPRTKDYGRKAQQVRSTLQSQNQGRFTEGIEVDGALQGHDQADLVGNMNYYSPVQLRELGVS